MLENDLDLICKAATEAGKIAMRFYRNNPTHWEKGDGQGPVSEADLEIDKMLFELLSTYRPNYGFLSEESEYNNDRFDLKDIFIIFTIMILSIGLIVWVIKAVGYLDIIAEDGHGFEVYFKYAALNFPRIVTRILPFIFIVSLFYKIIEYEKRNEKYENLNKYIN